VASTIEPEVLQDDIAVSIARVIASANKRARALGVDVSHSIVSFDQHFANGDWLWRINYGPKDYVGQRGGDLILDVDPSDGSVRQVLWGQ
jgi:hypothetical protein